LAAFLPDESGIRPLSLFIFFFVAPRQTTDKAAEQAEMPGLNSALIAIQLPPF
jgi:hypothetical protein